jgi:pyruvate formate lyase activating enzyme
VNECRIPELGVGYCGVREASGAKAVMKLGTAARGAVQWYFDPLPTNCVAAWVCPECRELEGRRRHRILFTI